MNHLTAIIAGLVVALAGCANRKNVPCSDEMDCDLSAGGICLAGPSVDRWCAYPDPACESGYRYSTYDVGDGASGQCAAQLGDAGPDGIGKRCDITKPFAAPIPLLALNSSLEEQSLSVTSNELVAFLHRGDPVTLLMATRSSPSSEFVLETSASVLSALLAVDGFEYHPTTSSDGLALYFVRSDQTTSAIYVSTRGTLDVPFSPGTQVSVDNSRLDFIAPQVSRDGQTLYWFDYGGTERKIYAASRGLNPSTFTNRRAVTSFQVGLNYALSADELTLYYSDDQGNDMFRATRASKEVAFQNGLPLANVNSTSPDAPLAVSDDDCILFIRTSRPGGLGASDVWAAHRP